VTQNILCASFPSFDSGQDSAENRVSIRDASNQIGLTIAKQLADEGGPSPLFKPWPTSHRHKRSKKRTADTYDNEQDLIAESHHRGGG
jgi:hypothetical protein